MSSHPHRIDWQELITDLHRARLGGTAIARRVGVARTTIISYREYGKTPLHQTGEKLIELWIEVTHRDRAHLPRVVVDTGDVRPELQNVTTVTA